MAVEAHHGAVLADKMRSVLAVAAEAHGAFHVAFHGNENAVVGHALVVECPTAYRIIVSGPQVKATVLSGSNGGGSMRPVTTPTLPCQSPVARSTVTSTNGVETSAPSLQLLPVQDVRWVRAP